MAHIRYDVTDGGSADSAWLSPGAAIGREANTLADRGDLVAVLGPGLGMGAPACFIPALAEVQVDTDVCLPGLSPEDVDLGDRLQLLTFPSFYGALAHEAAHAKHTKIDLAALHSRKDVTRRHVDVVLALEEPRIEAALLRSYRGGIGALNRSDLRLVLSTCAAEIVLRDFRIAPDAYGASIAAALLLARVDGGTLNRADVTEPRDLIIGVLGEDVLATLRDLWTRFFALDDDDVEGMIQISREWLDAISVDADDDTDNLAGESLTGEGGESGEGEGDESEGEGESDGEDGEDGKGSGEGSGSGEGDEDSWVKAMAEAIREYLTDKDAEVTEARGSERTIRRAAARAEDAKRVASAEKAASKAFGGHGYSDEVSVRRFAPLAPTAEMRKGAVSLAGKLSRVTYSDRSVVKTTSAAPPGRLRGKAMVAGAAERARGAMAATEPWQAKRRHHTDTPPLTVGFIQDVSGSMGSAEVPTAVAAWTMLEAGRKIDAKVASVLMGSDAFGAIPPGAKHKVAHVYPATAGSEAFRASFLALDGILNLVDGSGARLLVIASDAQLVNGTDEDYCRYAMNLCRQRGVAVVWLDFTRCFESNHGWGEVVPVWGKSADEVAALVGDAAIRAFRKVVATV